MEEIANHKVKEQRLEFWNNSRFRLNKLLTVSGLLVIVFCAIIFAYVLPSSDDIPAVNIYFFLIAIVIYLVYIAAINLLFLLLEIVDRTFIKTENLKTRNILLNSFHWISFGVPFLYPLFLLTMYYLH